jgi:catechol 2,3-dioxygenase-like lactoylglutathione lyase family enzyme
MPTSTITRLLETSLYADDIAATAEFYEAVIGLRAMMRSPRLVAFDAGGGTVLLVFQKGLTAEDSRTEGGVVPGHDGSGRLHLALAIPADSLDAWRGRFIAHGVAIVAETRWARGGTSLYVHDPDGHVLELATPGLWDNY